LNERINIDDIAQAAGVSKATVSQVLRNAGRISSETRKQVMQIAADLGYVYNRAAANLRAGHSMTIGIGVSSLSNPFFAELVSGAADVLEEAGYFPMIVNVEDDLGRQQRFATTLRENMSAGAVLCLAPGSSPKLLAEWKAAIEHSVMVLRPPQAPLFDFVGVSNSEGSSSATEHLISLGHRVIAYIGGTSISTSREARIEGWRRSMIAAELSPDEGLVEPCGATIAAGSEAVRQVLKRRPDVTAIVCHQDIVAFGVTIGLRKLHLEPGKAVSVVGFDDISMSADWDPALTTVSVTPRTLGREAARLLMRRIAEPEAALQSLFIRPKLVLRDTTAPPPIR
jgi:DNA-binding LacI/PurR family transcriptional regulator